MNTSGLLSLALAIVMAQGEPALKRAFTPPEEWVRKTCAATGADPAKAIEERDESAKVWAAFVADLANVHTTDDGQPLKKPKEVKAALVDTNLNIIGLGVMLYQVFGKQFLARALTIPEGDIRKVCEKTGADWQEVVASRNAAVEELVEFIESLVNKGFVDPD